MARRRITEEQLERAIALRERGWSLRRIAELIGACSPQALSWHFLARAVDPPKPAALRVDFHLRCPVMKRGAHVMRAFTPDDDARLIELERQGATVSAIGRALGRKPNSIKGRLMTLARREERAERQAGA